MEGESSSSFCWETGKRMDAITELDGRLLIWIQETFNAEWLTPIMKGITMMGDYGALLIIVCLLFLALRKTRRLGIICLSSLLLSFICCNLIIKPLVDRPRPWEVFEAVRPHLEPPGDASFPSGHSCNSMSLAWAMFLASMPQKAPGGDAKSYELTPPLGWRGKGASARAMHRLSIVMLILALLIAFSRLYLGMHFPTDVFFGLLLGIGAATLVNYGIGRYEAGRGFIGDRETCKRKE